MKLGVQGSRNFNNYEIFLRAMGSALREMSNDDQEFHVYTAGPAKINSMVMEFCNVSERSLKARGIKTRFFKVPPKWLKENILDMSDFYYFSQPKESASDILDEADQKMESPPQWYRY